MNNNSLTRQDVEFICRKNGFIISGYYTMASKNFSQNVYWANPNTKCLNMEWTLILNDYLNNTLYCFKIPAYSIKESQIKYKGQNKSLIDLQIKYNDNFFQDKWSSIYFEKWLVKTINY